MRNFARVTKLNNLVGRADYISNPKRQEKIVVQSEAVDFKPYHQYEKAHQKSNKKNNEGREVFFEIPNEWANLPADELTARAGKLAAIAAGKETDMQWAVHWNKARTNLHVHVVFSERTQTGDVKKYDRDVYHTVDGKVARSKKDRARDSEGNELPPVHRKGEIASMGFSVKETRYKTPEWLQETKNALKVELVHQGAKLAPDRESFELHQYHEGKGSQSASIALKNKAIEEANDYMKQLDAKGHKPSLLSKLKTRLLEVLHTSKIPVIVYDKERNRLAVHGATLHEIREQRQTAQSHTAVPISETKEPSRPVQSSFNALVTAKKLEELRTKYIRAKCPPKPYKENPEYWQRATDIDYTVMRINEQMESIEKLTAEHDSLGFIKVLEKRDLQRQVDQMKANLSGNVTKLKQLGVSDIGQAKEVAGQLRALITAESKKAKDRLEEIAEVTRIPADDIKAEYLVLKAGVPADMLAEVEADQKRIRPAYEDKIPRSMEGYKAKVEAMSALDGFGKTKEPRLPERNRSLIHER